MESERKMTRTKRKALLAAVLGLAAVATAVPMVITGTASAQTNARLCGRFWESVDRSGGEEKGTGEVVTRLYEVTKGDRLSCKSGNISDEFPKGFPGTLKEQGKTVREWHTDDFAMVVCEDWKTRDLKIGGLGNKALNFIGDNFPEEKNQTDICQNMNRNETVFDNGAYWLYENNVAPPAGTADTIDFWRHK